ncbi:helix-turn-helix transcriptional regulator [Paenibacillus sp. HN-1]|uniref:helix-turn-helix domain-containing protein n=1 Tax=Paenibacillus TaxID=44249 RepID=UPI001CA8824F|nr:MULTISPECIES: helix-turn-helix transcriptional regulator [Paenibacillus]MBY9081056.1 helix-turn-helix transcriptional regulator [Paenibacillus sp. CGMCC 1.18879]MBY9087093.1 helix-turn-helix transcriptional regulator [Paenibacillus sinensis]
MIRLDRLKERRIEKKLTHEELAGKLGISRQGYGNYESGKRDIDTETLTRICQILDADSDYFLGLSDVPKREPSLSFYGGPNDWTEDEFKAADDFIKEVRESRQRALDKAKNDH